jgi:hypothetical protein
MMTSCLQSLESGGVLARNQMIMMNIHERFSYSLLLLQADSSKRRLRLLASVDLSLLVIICFLFSIISGLY